MRVLLLVSLWLGLEFVMVSLRSRVLLGWLRSCVLRVWMGSYGGGIIW